ncbi:hypothetical protein B0H13DRAFT_1935434 [Mycena leptocephala]|nr:hypothetical protein B0H13DRAFT_1935434 [Mycena leptocephala]
MAGSCRAGDRALTKVRSVKALGPKIKRTYGLHGSGVLTERGGKLRVKGRKKVSMGHHAIRLNCLLGPAEGPHDRGLGSAGRGVHSKSRLHMTPDAESTAWRTGREVDSGEGEQIQSDHLAPKTLSPIVGPDLIDLSVAERQFAWGVLPVNSRSQVPLGRLLNRFWVAIPAFPGSIGSIALSFLGCNSLSVLLTDTRGLLSLHDAVVDGRVAASLPDDVRKKIMSRLCRLAAREPLEAAEAYLNLRPYKEHAGGGVAYVHLRPNREILENAADVPDDDELDWVDLKVGEAHDVDDRRDDYELDCVDEPILWAYCYQTAYPKLIERLTHLTLRAMGAQRVPYSCYGCGVRHREHFSAEKSGGLEVVAAIIEYWMRRIGEDPVRIPLYAR